MQQTVTKVLKSRLNGFQSFKDRSIGTSGPSTEYTVKGTDYPLVEDLVEFIEVRKTGQVTYTVIIADKWKSSEVAAAYQQGLTAEL